MKADITPLERLGIWSGLGAILVFGLSWLILARLAPPVSPLASAPEVAAFFLGKGWVMVLAGAGIIGAIFLMFPASALMVILVNGMERRQPIGMMTIMMGFVALTNIVVIFYLGVSWIWAAFRPDQNPELVRFAYDFGFLSFFGGIPMFVQMFFIPAYAILVECPKEQALMPRWFGYLCLLSGMVFMPAPLIYFFKSGPFAWDGIINFWIPLADLGIFFSITPFVWGPALEKLRSRQASKAVAT